MRAWATYDAWTIFIEMRAEQEFARWEIPTTVAGDAAMRSGFDSIAHALEDVDCGQLRSLVVQAGDRGLWLGAPPEWRTKTISNGWTWHACDGPRYSANAYFREDSDSRAVERALKEAEEWWSVDE